MHLRRFYSPATAGILLCVAPSTTDAAPSVLSAQRAGLELPGGWDRGSRRTGFARPAATPQARLASIEAELGVVFASWDEDTGIPSRIVPRNVVVSDSVADPKVAAEFATAFMQRHIDALAPGCADDDFVLVTNDLSGGIRSIGFVQQHRGIDVIGGQISLRFKNDRLSVVASEAFPHVVVPTTTVATVGRAAATRISDAFAASEARRWVEDDGLGRVSHPAGVNGPFVLPVVLDSGAIRYHEVMRTTVDTEAPTGRYEIFVDAASGEPIARRSKLLHASAQVLYNVPQRGPLGVRADSPAVGAEVIENNSTLVTATGGVVDFVGPSSDLTLTVQGSQVAVTNASGPAAATTVPATDGGVVVWNASDDEAVDASLAAFIHATIVKDYVRRIAPDFAFLDQQLPVTVNIEDTCNAFSDGFSINFFLSSPECENSGRLSDVVYHEFGHSSHTQSLLVGVGFFDVALSEGISDYLSATITGDSGVGRGFFYDDTPLREINPDGFEYRWPEDRGEVHAEGRIIGGALWDLRTLLVAKYGPAGIDLTDEIWFEATRRASNIPTMYVETLLVDDDDGNLANGTPNACEINAAYGSHGLFQAGDGAERVTLVDTGVSFDVQLQLSLPSFPDCPVSASPTIEWRLRDNPSETSTSEMTSDGEGGWVATLPRFDQEVIQYRVRANYSTGTERSLPDNFVDPWYEAYAGDVVPLYCLAEDPSATAWTFEGVGDDWSVSSPLTADPNDPSAPYDLDGIYIGQDGPYAPGADNRASLTVDTAGFSEVRLQYYRWLTVEDGYFDRATITADGSAVWSNHASTDDKAATFHHTDREWRFHDVDLSGFVDDGVVEVAFELASDGGLEFGGWTIDALCVVGVGAPATCGNGVVDPVEECDDGNRGDGDGCSSTCTAEDDSSSGTSGGVPPIDPEDTDSDGEDTDDGVGLDGDGGGLIGRGCACTTVGDDRGGPGWLGLLGLMFGLVRRRRQ